MPLDVLSNVVGADIQNFNPATGGIDFITVQSSETLSPGVFNFGLFVNYSENSIPYYYTDTDGEKSRIEDTMLGADLNFGVGLVKNLDAGVSLPRIMEQKVKSKNSNYEYTGSGSTEIKLNSRFKFLSAAHFGMAIVASTNLNLIVNNPYTGYNASPTYNLELVCDGKWKKWALATNAGYRIRNQGEPIAGSPIKPIEDQIIASLGASYLLKSIDTKIILEALGSLPAKRVEEGYNRSGESLEMLMGFKHDLTGSLSIHLGGGKRLIAENSSPEWRVYSGLNFAMGPVFSRPPPVVRVRKLPEKHFWKKSILLKDLDPFSQPPSEPEESFVVRDILFKFNSDEINPSASKLLGNLVKYIRQAPGYKKLVIEGHTDSVGNTFYNKHLSELRANNVRQYLIKNFNINPKKVIAKGYGETNPVASNGNYQGRRLNRRVEFNVIWKIIKRKTKR